jgi:hypothetical protein
MSDLLHSHQQREDPKLSSKNYDCGKHCNPINISCIQTLRLNINMGWYRAAFYVKIVDQFAVSHKPSLPNQYSFGIMFSSISVLLLTTSVLAAPSALEQLNNNLCPSPLYNTPQCCDTDVLGVAYLDCAAPPVNPPSPTIFKATCAAIGERASCCIIPILGSVVLCM